VNETRTDRTTTDTAARVTLRSPMSTPIRIIVGEPDYLAREGLVRALEAAEGLDVVSICSTMTSLESAAQLEQPDVVLMPLVFPPNRASGAIQFLTELQAAQPETGVVVTGEHSDLVHALPLFDSGIARRAFIVRSRIRNASQLTRAIREVASGNSLVDPAAVGTLLNAARRRADYPFGSLTEREREVLGMIAEAESNNAIARHLHITTRAVERHINSIFRKLGLSGSRDVNRRVQAALAFSASMQGEPNGKAVHPVRARH
jgi:DNA-binding NarL/FixJ family response regulator